MIITKQYDNLFLGPSSLRDEPHCPWIIALTTDSDALFVYSLLVERDFSAISLAFLPVDEGIRCPVGLSIPLSVRTVHTVIPIRVQDYDLVVMSELPKYLSIYCFKVVL